MSEVLDYKISKRTIEPGWAEIRIVMQRKIPDSPDFDLLGQAARTKLQKTIVAMAAGMANMLGDEKFEEMCVRFGKKHGLLFIGS